MMQNTCHLRYNHMIRLDTPFTRSSFAHTLTPKSGFLNSYTHFQVGRTALKRKGYLAFRCQCSINDQSASKAPEDSAGANIPNDQIPVSHEHAETTGSSISLSLFRSASNAFKADELGWEIASIALPALLALAADPLASLVDTAFIGQLGSVELAAVGVSIAVFNLASKLFNIPVLNLTTSYVAEEATNAEEATSEEEVSSVNANRSTGASKTRTSTNVTDVNSRKCIPAVSTALVLGSILGLFELFVLTIGAGPVLDVMGVPSTSSMRIPAEQYLSLRALGAPAVVISLAVQGVFRGFKDTKTPLYATVSGNIINTVLVPILVFYLGYGVSGAAIATVISEYFIALTLLFRMNSKVVLLPPKLSDLELDRFLKNGGLLFARSTAVMLTFTLATSLAARQGTIPMAAHQICVQVWLAASLLSDAIALAGQTIIASAMAKDDYGLAKDAAFRTLQIGCAFGLALSLLLGVGLSLFPKLFTNDPLVIEYLAIGIPFVAVTQPINAIAFVFDGLHFGALDFAYAAQSMIIVAVISSIIMVLAGSMWGFIGIWVALTTLMSLRMFAGFFRIGSASGPWKFLKKYS